MNPTDNGAKTMDTITHTGYILATADAIMATGTTPELAIAQYVREIRPIDDTGSRLVESDLDAEALLRAPTDHSRALYLRPATQRLLNAVDLNGGDIVWRIVDDVADLPVEAD